MSLWLDQGQYLAYLKKIGYKNTTFKVHNSPIPSSPPKKDEWELGNELLDYLDETFRVPKRPVNRPFRMPIEEIYKIGGIGTIVCGRVESGTL